MDNKTKIIIGLVAAVVILLILAVVFFMNGQAQAAGGAGIAAVAAAVAAAKKSRDETQAKVDDANAQGEEGKEAIDKASDALADNMSGTQGEMDANAHRVAEMTPEEKARLGDALLGAVHDDESDTDHV